MPNKVTVYLRTERQLTSPEIFNIIPDGDQNVISDDGEIAVGIQDTESLSEALKELLHSENNNLCESVTEGILTVKNGGVTLKYSEPWGSRVFISFMQNDPGLITITRTDIESGEKLCMTFEAGRRHITVCKKGGETFEVISYASRIENSMLRRGTLTIVYSVEIHGARAERTRLEIKLKNKK